MTDEHVRFEEAFKDANRDLPCILGGLLGGTGGAPGGVRPHRFEARFSGLRKPRGIGGSHGHRPGSYVPTEDGTLQHEPTYTTGSAAPLAPRLVLGMMGGIGAGKSYVARRTGELGQGRVVDADVIAHEALALYAADGRLAEAVGAEFVCDGKPDVKALGRRAFEDPALLRRLERLIHPYAHSAIKVAIDDFRSGDGPSLLVLDVPLLIEVGLDRHCDTLWYVEAPDGLRAERAQQRGLTLEQIRMREAFQSPRERKRARADHVIRNDVPPAELDRQILAGLARVGLAHVGGDVDVTCDADGEPGREASGETAVGNPIP